METLSPREQFMPEIKATCVENYSDRGYTPKGDRKMMDSVLYFSAVNKKLGLSGTSDYANLENTNVAVVPLSSPDVIKLPANFDPKDVALCVAFSAVNVDRSGRSGKMKAAIVVSKANATKFIDSVRQSPELIYDLLRKANGGPITKFDGTPMDINP